MEKQKRFDDHISLKNKKAYYEYHILDSFVAGIALVGTEIKSIRERKVSINEAYCYFKDNELFIKNMNITPYANASFRNHDPFRERKLLLKKKELIKFKKKKKAEGITIIPLALFMERGLAKLKIAVAKGKQLHDKRQSLKEKQQKREINRLM